MSTTFFKYAVRIFLFVCFYKLVTIHIFFKKKKTLKVRPWDLFKIKQLEGYFKIL